MHRHGCLKHRISTITYRVWFCTKLSMRWFLRIIFRSLQDPRSPKYRSFSTSPTMSSAATAAVLYAATISASAITEAKPEEAKDRSHHLQDGMGFMNPWESWRDMASLEIVRALAWRVSLALDDKHRTNGVKAKAIRRRKISRHHASDGTRSEACFPPVERNWYLACHMAGPCLLLC